MPTTVVKPIAVDTFKPYAALGKSNGKIQSRICELLFRLVQTDDPAKVKTLCKEEIAWLESENYKAATRTAYVSAYRKALQDWFTDNPPANKMLLSERETVKGTVTQHCALDYLIAAPSDYAEGQQKTKRKTAKQRDNLTGFNAAAAVDATKKALQSEDWRELAVGLIMATQSRPSDMLSTGEFKAVSKYRLEFTSRAKKRGKTATGEIFCLVDSVTFIDAFSRLRREAEVMEMKDWKLKDVDSGKNATLNRAVTRIYGEIIPIPYGEKALSCKNLRAAGVNAAYWLHGRDNQSLGRFAELQLLHDNPGTAANYEDFYAAGADGDRLLKVGILKDAPIESKPLSEKRSSLTLDRQLLATIADAEQWGDGSHADRLTRIIAKAKTTEKLERQHDRNLEKIEALELDVKRLQSVIETLADGEKTAVKAEAKAIAAAPAVGVVEESSGFDWRSVPNDDLKSDRRHEAYAEKLRRSVEAIQDYNAGRDDSEHYSITGSLLRQLTGVKPGKVKQWMTENKAALDGYNAGYSTRQNVGKPDPKSAIKWSEQAYGEYEW